MYPKLWEATGVDYSTLIDRLVQVALDRHTVREHARSSLSVERMVADYLDVYRELARGDAPRPGDRRSARDVVRRLQVGA